LCHMFKVIRDRKGGSVKKKRREKMKKAHRRGEGEGFFLVPKRGKGSNLPEKRKKKGKGGI